MSKRVLVSVTGLLFGTGANGEPEDIEVVAPGEYYQKNGKHYVLYEEMDEDFSEPIQNLLKISSDQVYLRKRGLINTEMTFVRNTEKTSHYSTPFGNLVLGVHARELQIQEEPDKIQVDLHYALEINYEHISDCNLHIQVQPKEGEFLFGELQTP